jgi:hypothetical protein
MKPIYAALIAAFLLPALAQAEDKFLHFQFNKHTVITISNVKCPLKDFEKAYPWAVVATRVDGARLVGCFNKMDENYIKIQWQDINGAKADFTVLSSLNYDPRTIRILAARLFRDCRRSAN